MLLNRLSTKYMSTYSTNQLILDWLTWFSKEVIKITLFSENVLQLCNCMICYYSLCGRTDSFKHSVVSGVLPFIIRFFNLGFDLICNLLWTADNFGWRCFTFLLCQRVSTALFHIGKERQGWSNKKKLPLRRCVRTTELALSVHNHG